jgi:hypothetical protein
VLLVALGGFPDHDAGNEYGLSRAIPLPPHTRNLLSGDHKDIARGFRQQVARDGRFHV